MNINSINQRFYDYVEMFQEYRQYAGDRIVPQAPASIGMVPQAVRGNAVLISNPSINFGDSNNPVTVEECRVVVEFYSPSFDWAIGSADGFAEMFNEVRLEGNDYTLYIKHSTTTIAELVKDGYVAAVTFEVHNYTQ